MHKITKNLVGKGNNNKQKKCLKMEKVKNGESKEWRKTRFTDCHL